MKPAICYLCGKFSSEESAEKKGDWVEFQDYDEKYVHSLSHPQGLEYFCGEHVFAAEQLKNKKSDIALKELENLYPQSKSVERSINPKISWWQRWVNR